MASIMLVYLLNKLILITPFVYKNTFRVYIYVDNLTGQTRFYNYKVYCTF